MLKFFVLSAFVAGGLSGCKTNETVSGEEASKSTQTIDCDNQPFNRIPVVGSISPTKAREVLRDQNFNSAPELKLFKKSFPEMKAPLEIGLAMQKNGNESMVYNVDSLVYISEGDGAGRGTKHELFSLYDRTSRQTSTGNSYYALFQLQGTLRVIATLRLMQRDAEADILQKYADKVLTTVENNALSQASQLAGPLQGVRQLMSNTGRVSSATDSKDLCKKILTLK